jgi:hypothetical protein
MAKISSASDARYAAGRNHPNANDFKPLPGTSGLTIGWTFEVISEGRFRYGWVLADGRVSPALEDYRSGAAAYGLRVFEDR